MIKTRPKGRRQVQITTAILLRSAECGVETDGVRVSLLRSLPITRG